MSEVAARAGVHPATVSRALREDPRITLEQRARVQRVARQLGYRPNPLVAALMSARRSGRHPAYQATIACLTRNASERAADFARDFGALIAGARERARALGYGMDAFNVEPGVTPGRTAAILHHRGIRGLLVAPLYSVHDPIELDWAEFSTVAIGYSLHQVPASRVAHNHFTALAVAAERARAAGWRRVGLVLQRRIHEKVERRWVAASMLDQSEQVAADRVPPLLLDEDGEEAFRAWMSRYEPEVVLAVHLPEILAWLKRLGRRVPADVSVVSLDRRPKDRGVAGIDQDYASLGASAVDMLIGMLHRNERGLPATPLTVLSEGRWVGGKSLRKR